MAPDSARPRVFVSYTHDSPEHENAVLVLADRLRADGVDAIIDQYEQFPAKGWPHWMRQQVEEADFVLAVCTETYRRRVEGNEAPNRGLGGVYEGSIIDQALYETSSENRKYIPVFLTAKDSDHVPQFLRKYTSFAIDSGYEDLYGLLTNQLKVAKPGLGRLRVLPKRAKRSDYRAVRWNIPGRNDYFTGRDQHLEALHEAFAHGEAAALTQAIKGLGGIGKSQIAIEYANRHRDAYGAGFWMMADSRDALISGFAGLTTLLDLPQGAEQDLTKVALAAKAWFEANSGWLLILDNVESLGDVKGWIPAGHRGHILITTRLQATGTIARGIDLPKMTSAEGVEFLMRRAKAENASEFERAAARDFSNEVDGLPLALDQAGAYIEEAQLAASEYLILYRREGKKLREKVPETTDHASVTATFSLAFEKLTERSKDLVRMCAFVAPDAIYERILTDGAEPDVAFHDAIAEAGKYSLIFRSTANRTVEIHRLVQEVIRDRMSPADRRLWADRAVCAVHKVLVQPEPVYWKICESDLPHARTVIELIERFNLHTVSAFSVLLWTATYLHGRRFDVEAEALTDRALGMGEAVLGPDSPEVANASGLLASIYADQGRYDLAEHMYLRAINIYVKMYGTEHPNIAAVLNNLSALMDATGRADEAELLLRRALDIDEKWHGSDSPEIASDLHNLAVFRSRRDDFVEAEALYRRAIHLCLTTCPAVPQVANAFKGLAVVFQRQKRYDEGEQMFQQALDVFEKIYGIAHPSTISCVRDYASMLGEVDRKDEARALEARFKIEPLQPSS